MHALEEGDIPRILLPLGPCVGQMLPLDQLKSLFSPNMNDRIIFRGRTQACGST
jgi:hypothetical protein